DLCRFVPQDHRVHYVQEGVGHYGVFNGTRWRTEIQPRIREFIRTVSHKRPSDEPARATQTYKVAKEAPAGLAASECRTKPNGNLSCANGKHPPMPAGE